jgi:hypothetical protein
VAGTRGCGNSRLWLAAGGDSRAGCARDEEKPAIVYACTGTEHAVLQGYLRERRDSTRDLRRDRPVSAHLATADYDPELTGYSRHSLDQRTGCDRLRAAAARHSLCGMCVVAVVPPSATARERLSLSEDQRSVRFGVGGQSGSLRQEPPGVNDSSADDTHSPLPDARRGLVLWPL